MSNIDKQALRERYTEKPAPKCHICGSVMTIQRAGAGGVVYGCTGRIDKDGEGYKFADGRDFADDHYARSRVTDADESDPDVIALLDELEAAEHTAAVDHEAACSLVEENEEVKRKLAAAEKRIADYHRALNNLASVARRYLPDYDEHPDIQAADDLLENAATHQGSQLVSNRDELPVSEIECDICGFKSTDPDGAHYCCEDNSND